MDNLSVHTAGVIQDVIEAVGARVVFLPPYSPDLSPIELGRVKTQTVFACCKSQNHRGT